MCLDFSKIDFVKLNTDLKNLVPTSGKVDPILGQKTPRDAIWHVFTNKHGTLIQFSLLEFIRAVGEWQGQVEFKFIPDKTDQKAFFDNIVYNREIGAVIVFECKRRYENVSGPYGRNIDRYKNLCHQYSKEIFQELGISGKNKKLFFTIFDAYGEGVKPHDHGIRITRPSDLNRIFPSCLFNAWQSLEREIYEILQKNDIPISHEFSERVMNSSTLTELRNQENGDMNLCDNPRLSQLSEVFGESFL